MAGKEEWGYIRLLGLIREGKALSGIAKGRDFGFRIGEL